MEGDRHGRSSPIARRHGSASPSACSSRTTPCGLSAQACCRRWQPPWRGLLRHPSERPFETHLVSATFLIPLLTLALARCVARPTVSRAVAAAMTAGLSVYFSEYYTPFLWLALIALVLFAALRSDTRATLRTMVEALGGRGIAAAAGAFLLTIAPFFVNWSPTRVERFNEGQAYFESANLAGFVVPDPTATHLYSSFGGIDRLNARVRRGVGGAALFLGLPVLIFGVIGLARADPRIRWILLSLSLTFLALSLGPELKVFETNTRVPLPYRALMLVPPFDLQGRRRGWLQ